MRLEWQYSQPEPSDRVFCQVPEGCMFAEITPSRKVFISLLATDPSIGGILPREWAGHRFATPQHAINAMTDWYHSTRKEQSDD